MELKISRNLFILVIAAVLIGTALLAANASITPAGPSAGPQIKACQSACGGACCPVKEDLPQGCGGGCGGGPKACSGEKP